MGKDLLKLLLPSEVYAHFDLVGIEENTDHFVLFLDEKDLPPCRYNHTYISKGFFPSADIRDFPLRGKSVFLRVRKRKWLEEQTGNVVSNRFELTWSGTRLNPEFVALLKELYRG